MNITFITPRFSFGGYEKVVVNYANAFSYLGHHVTIVCGFREGEYLKDVDKSVKIVELKARIRGFIVPLAKYLKNNKVDILYTCFRSYTCIGVLARTLSGNRDCVIYGSAHGYGRDYRLLEILEGKIMCHADVLTSITQELAEFESNALQVPLDKYVVFNNPVVDDRLPIRKEKHPWFEDKRIPIIVCSGRMDYNKHNNIAVKMFAELQKQLKSRLMFLGDGVERPAVEKLAKDLGVSQDVAFLGFVENPMGYMIQCNVFLHTAEIEAFGNVIVEALYCGLPVVTTDCKGPVEIIKKDQYGITVGKTSDPQLIQQGADALYAILTGTKQFEGLQKRALEFDAKYNEQDFLEPYNKVVRARKKGSSK